MRKKFHDKFDILGSKNDNKINWSNSELKKFI